MPNDHRGNPIGNPATSHGGHRPTPRLAQLVAQQMNDTIRDETYKRDMAIGNQNALTMFLPRNAGYRASQYATPEHAQEAIDDYREQRNEFGDLSKLDKMDKQLFDSWVTPSAKVINKAFNERGKEPDGYYYRGA
jgi:hypothetical protein